MNEEEEFLNPILKEKREVEETKENIGDFNLFKSNDNDN